MFSITLDAFIKKCEKEECQACKKSIPSGLEDPRPEEDSVSKVCVQITPHQLKRIYVIHDRRRGVNELRSMSWMMMMVMYRSCWIKS